MFSPNRDFFLRIFFTKAFRDEAVMGGGWVEAQLQLQPADDQPNYHVKAIGSETMLT
jgi:hypothetical protein